MKKNIFVGLIFLSLTGCIKVHEDVALPIPPAKVEPVPEGTSTPPPQKEKDNDQNITVTIPLPPPAVNSGGTTIINQVVNEGPKVNSIEILQGNNQTVHSSSPAPLALKVKIKDSQNQPIKSFPVQWSASSGNVSNSVKYTDDNGISQITYSASIYVGAVTIDVVSGSKNVTFTLNVIPNPNNPSPNPSGTTSPTPTPVPTIEPGPNGQPIIKIDSNSPIVENVQIPNQTNTEPTPTPEEIEENNISAPPDGISEGQQIEVVLTEQKDPNDTSATLTELKIDVRDQRLEGLTTIDAGGLPIDFLGEQYIPTNTTEYTQSFVEFVTPNSSSDNVTETDWPIILSTNKLKYFDISDIYEQLKVFVYSTFSNGTKIKGSFLIRRNELVNGKIKVKDGAVSSNELRIRQSSFKITKNIVDSVYTYPYGDRMADFFEINRNGSKEYYFLARNENEFTKLFKYTPTTGRIDQVIELNQFTHDFRQVIEHENALYLVASLSDGPQIFRYDGVNLVQITNITWSIYSSSYAAISFKKQNGILRVKIENSYTSVDGDYILLPEYNKIVKLNYYSVGEVIHYAQKIYFNDGADLYAFNITNNSKTLVYQNYWGINKLFVFGHNLYIQSGTHLYRYNDGTNTVFSILRAETSELFGSISGHFIYKNKLYIATSNSGGWLLRISENAPADQIEHVLSLDGYSSFNYTQDLIEVGDLLYFLDSTILYKFNGKTLVRMGSVSKPLNPIVFTDSKKIKYKAVVNGTVADVEICDLAIGCSGE